MKQISFWLLLYCLSVPVLAQDTASTNGLSLSIANVDIDDAWGQLQSDNSVAIYMLLVSKQADRLIGLSSALAGRAELHTHVTASDVLQTRPVTGIDLPAKMKVRLEPGGLHAVLLDMSEPLIPGQLIPLTLRFLSGSELTLRVALR